MDDFLKLSDDWGELQNGGSIVPYGIGRIGRRVIPTLLKEFKVPFLVDKKKDSEEVFGLRVCDLRSTTYKRKKFEDSSYHSQIFL